MSQGLEEHTFAPVASNVSPVNNFFIEHSSVLSTGVFKESVRADSITSITVLKNLFGSVVLKSVSCEVRQDALIGAEDADLCPTGHVFVALVPSGNNTDAKCGLSTMVVNGVPNKQTFPLSSAEQNNVVFNFKLDGYEVDLAQDPRRRQGVVLWMGNSGVTTTGTVPVTIATATWRLAVECSGTSTLW